MQDETLSDQKFKMKNSQRQVLIAEKGVIVGNIFHLWAKLGASLDEVTLEYGSETNLNSLS